MSTNATFLRLPYMSYSLLPSAQAGRWLVRHHGGWTRVRHRYSALRQGVWPGRQGPLCRRLVLGTRNNKGRHTILFYEVRHFSPNWEKGLFLYVKVCLTWTTNSFWGGGKTLVVRPLKKTCVSSLRAAIKDCFGRGKFPLWSGFNGI